MSGWLVGLRLSLNATQPRRHRWQTRHVSFRPVELVRLLGGGPGDLGVLAECDGAGGGVDVGGDEAGADGGGAAGEEGADGDGEAELFGDFAGEGGGGGFAGFDFAAREFPFAGEAAVGAALGDEALVALRDGGADNVEGRDGRECSCCRRTGGAG